MTLVNLHIIILSVGIALLLGGIGLYAVVTAVIEWKRLLRRKE